MHFFSEHRLCHLTQAQLDAQRKAAGLQPTTISKSSDQKAATLQNSNAATKGTREGSNPYADVVEENIQTNFDPSTATPDEIERQRLATELAATGAQYQQPGYNPAKAAMEQPAAPKGVIDQSALKRLMDAGMTREEALARMEYNKPAIKSTASNTGLGGTFDVNGMFVPPVTQTPAERNAALNLQRQIADLSKSVGPQPPLYDSKGNIIKTGKQVQAEMDAARAKQATELQRQLSEQQKRMADKQKATAASGVTGPSTPGTTPTTQAVPPPATSPAPAAPAAPVPPIDPATGLPSPDAAATPESALEDARATALEGLNKRLENINAADPNAIDPEKAKADALKSYQDQLDAAAEQEKLDQEKALEKQRDSLALLDRAEELEKIEMAKQELDQIRTNTQNEVKNRRRINKLSGGHDFGGLDWVQQQTQQGLDTLNYLRAKTANMHGAYADKSIAIINQYALDLKQAEATKKQKYADDYDAYLKRLDDVRKELKNDEMDKKKLRDDAHKDYSKTLTDADFKYGDYLKELALKARDRMWEVEDRDLKAKETSFSQGISFVNLLKDKKIGSTPESLRIAEKMMNLPAGSLSILAEVSGSGGGGIGSVSGYTPAQIQEAALAYFKTYNKLPSKSEIPVMVATFFQNRTQVQAGMSTERGEMPDIFTNPFEEMRLNAELGTEYANYARAKADGDYKFGWNQWLKDRKLPLFAMPDFSDLGQQAVPTGTTDTAGVTTFR